MDNFEQDLKRLEEIIKKLENGEAGLGESMKLFDEGVNLMNSLSKALDEAQAKITLLTSEKTENE